MTNAEIKTRFDEIVNAVTEEINAVCEDPAKYCVSSVASVAVGGVIAEMKNGKYKQQIDTLHREVNQSGGDENYFYSLWNEFDRCANSVSRLSNWDTNTKGAADNE